MPELKIGTRRVVAGADVDAALKIIESEYGGNLVYDNGQAEGPFVAFAFPGTPVQVGARLNKRNLTLYVRERTPSGAALPEAVPGLREVERYDASTGSPVNSIKDGRVPYLRLSEAPVVRVVVKPEHLRAVLDACLGVSPAAPAEAGRPSMSPAGGSSDAARRPRPPMSPEELLSQLDRRSELGRQGEEIAFLYELERIRRLGCRTPEDYVTHVALEDVGRGYDIESSWPGEERYIEVKTSSATGSGFYLSVNERNVLKVLGDRAWIYRVAPGASSLEVVSEICNPISLIPEDRFTPQVWRVQWP